MEAIFRNKIQIVVWNDNHETIFCLLFQYHVKYNGSKTLRHHQHSQLWFQYHVKYNGSKTSEQAQLMRRMAEIYDERATALRER